MDRRKFLRLAALAGTAAFAPSLLRTALAGSSPFGLPPKPVPPTRLPEEIPRVFKSPLRVAQWYDYWPGKVLRDFEAYVAQTYGASVEVQWDVFTSNDELLGWLLERRPLDVVFPSQDTLEWLKAFGLLRPLDRDLVPNLTNLFPEYERPPWALDRAGNVYAAAYNAGTTGLAFRTDRGWTTADVDGIGWDLLWLDAFQGSSLDQRLAALADDRELIGMGLKKAGYDATGRALVAEGQWSLNTEDLSRVAAAKTALLQARPRWFTIGTNVAPLLLNGVVDATQIWSVDAMYAIRPNTTPPGPADYVHPKQGFARWVDSAAICTFSDNVYLAHLFIDYLLRGDVAALVANWLVGATTPNAAAYDVLAPYPNGWDPRQDPRLYPDGTTLARGEYAQSLPAAADRAYEQAYAEVMSA